MFDRICKSPLYPSEFDSQYVVQRLSEIQTSTCEVDFDGYAGQASRLNRFFMAESEQVFASGRLS